MKKVATFIAAVLLGAVSFSASAQLTIGKKNEAVKRVATLQQFVEWLYQMDDNYYYVMATNNEFDDWMWLELGGTKEEAATTTRSLIEALEGAERGESIEVESRGEKYLLTCNTFMGAKAWMVSDIKTRKAYAGDGPMNMSSLRKALKFFETK